MTPLPSQRVLDRIQNIEMGTCVQHTGDFTETLCKTLGSHTKRNTCRISFPCYDCLVFSEYHPSFFRGCQYLVGFKTVTVTLDILWADVEEYEELLEALLEDCNSTREDFKAALEPHLGPSRAYNVGNVFFLEFHPRKHLENVQSALPMSGGKPLCLEQDAESGAMAR